MVSPKGRSVAEARPPTLGDRDPLIGRKIDGRYEITSALARGGMSRVYRAEQHPLGRTVAVKVLALSGGAEQAEEFRQRFLLEAAVCARLTHPNTVRVFDHGQVGDELLYIVMEYLDGRTLHQVIKAEGSLPASRIVNIARQVCGSLREAHGLGLIHRDLKPANVVLLNHDEDEDFVKVLDFGLVKQMRTDDELTGTDAVVGSPSYMAPEQIRAERLDGRSDIYSLGVILYTAIAGRPPFVADNSVGVLLAHLNQPPPRLEANAPALVACPTLGWVVERCLEKTAERRFADVEELLRALRLCEAELRGEAVAPPQLRQGRLVREPSSPRTPSPPRAPAPTPEPSASTMVSAVRSRKGPLLAATGAMAALMMFGAAVVIFALGAWWWSSQRGDAAASTPTSAPEAVLAAPARPAPPVVLSTIPAAATVRRDGAVLGSGSVTLTIPSGEVWEVEVAAPGYTTARIRIPWDSVRRQVVLNPTAAVPKEPAKRGPGTAAPETGAPLPPTTSSPETPTAPTKRTSGSDLKDPWSP